MKSLRLEWPTLGLVCLAYAGWFLGGWLIYPLAPWAGVGLMILCTALHASLVHEACHGHPTRLGWLNEALVTANPGLVWPYRRFRRLHLQHHSDDRLTDPFDDPESFYRAAWWYAGLHPALQRLLGWSNTVIGRLVIGPPMSTVALLAGDIAKVRRGGRDVALAWGIHLVGLVPVLAVVTQVFAIPLWLYALAVAWPAMSIIMLRSFAEHRWHESPEGRTIIVERSPLAFLFLNNNLHLVHHSYPGVAWYRLPALYRAEVEAWRQRNDGYVFGCYWHLLRAYLFHAKEPIAHPAWHRDRAGVE